MNEKLVDQANAFKTHLCFSLSLSSSPYTSLPSLPQPPQRLSRVLSALVGGAEFDLERASMERARALSSLGASASTMMLDDVDDLPSTSSSSSTPAFWGADLAFSAASSSSSSGALELWSGARKTAAAAAEAGASSSSSASSSRPLPPPSALFAASLAGAEAAAATRRRERDEEAARASAAFDECNEDDGVDDPLAPKRSKPPPLGAVWLRSWLAKAQRRGGSNGATGSSGITNSEDADALATAVARLVLEPASSTSDDRLASELFELIGGEDALDAIQELVERRRPLAAGLRALASAARAAAAAAEKEALEESEAAAASAFTSSQGPSVGAGISVATAAERAVEKALRKASRKAGKSASSSSLNLDPVSSAASSSSSAASALLSAARGGTDQDIAWIASRGVHALAEAEAAADAAARDPLTLPGGLVLAAADGNSSSNSSLARSLPVGTTRITHKGYEEIRVPAPRDKLPPDSEEPLVPVSALPPWAQPAFAGMSSLNRIQSRIFPAAFQSNVNLLVCAPTGAGKTNIAMLAVLRECGAHLEEVKGSGGNGFGRGRNGGGGGGNNNSSNRNQQPQQPSQPSFRVRKADVKVVYVAPMKALAAEVTAAFSRRLAPLGLTVRELTGDTQLSRREMEETNMIVTTPEKWDVVTRKGGEGAGASSGGSAASAVRLLIIDEVHLLNDERGAVIETLVARTHRAVEAAQVVIRVVGLSATLPNHRDVAAFLGAPVGSGVFHFDARFRPVPLDMTFVGISTKNHQQQRQQMDDVAYDRVSQALKDGHQAMVFVHSRKNTGKTARALLTTARARGEAALFDGATLAVRKVEDGDGNTSQAPPELNPRASLAARDLAKSRDRELQEVAGAGVGLHHAGMLRADRSLVERLFSEGCVKVLCCTATLAWGVNLPAHCVVIKGTQLYDPQAGGFTSLGLLDVQQIFGRAGRPQFDTSGDASIITTSEELPHFLSMLTHQAPIESRFVAGLVDNLNAEVVLGTVSTVAEGSAWLSYTYLFVRMLRNPLAYGITWAELAADPRLEARRRSLISEAAKQLEECRMVRFDARSGALHATELGRIASHFYVSAASVVAWSECLKPNMTEADFLAMLSRSSEFENVALRDDEAAELEDLARDACPFDVRAGGGGGSKDKEKGKEMTSRYGDAGEDLYSKVTTTSSSSSSGPNATAGRGVAATATKHGKVSVLLQAYVSRARPDAFSLVADSNYVAANAPRLCRAAFEILVRRGWPGAAELALSFCKAFDARLWPHQHPLRQVEAHAQRLAGGGGGGKRFFGRNASSSSWAISDEILSKLEERSISLDVLADASASEIGAMLRHPAAGETVAAAVRRFPHLELSGKLQPLTRGVVRLTLSLVPCFEWSDRCHGGSLRWHVWVEDSEGTRLHHAELWTMTKKVAVQAEAARRRKSEGLNNGDADDADDDFDFSSSTSSSSLDPATTLVFTLPAPDPLPTNYYVRALSDEWAGAEVVLPLQLRGALRMPAPPSPPTELLLSSSAAGGGGGSIDPLPLSALDWPEAEKCFSHGSSFFTHFNPVLTQAFHALYHRDESVLLGAPAGSGKTVAAELAILRLLRKKNRKESNSSSSLSSPSSSPIAVYLTPMRALARERAEDWRARGLFGSSSSSGPSSSSFSSSSSSSSSSSGLGFRLVELSDEGDSSSSSSSPLLASADVAVATPGAWDAATRGGNSASSWLRRVELMVLDEIHLLGGGGGGGGGGAAEGGSGSGGGSGGGGGNGALLEAVVSRARRLSASSSSPSKIRFVALSASLANAEDLAAWLGVGEKSSTSSSSSTFSSSSASNSKSNNPFLFNFAPSARPLPLEAHIQGYPGRHYLPRMASMNRPTYSAIVAHAAGNGGEGRNTSASSASSGVVVFVSSRRQTRLTALDLIGCAAAADDPRRFLKMQSEGELELALATVRDATLRHCLAFGVGLHHDGLCSGDRGTVERLFKEGKIQVVVATSVSSIPLPTGIPVRLVVVKGTEVYDGAKGGYVDLPIADVLRMMGRAGTSSSSSCSSCSSSSSSSFSPPSSSNSVSSSPPPAGVAVVMVAEPKKAFYKKFLCEPLALESALAEEEVVVGGASAFSPSSSSSSSPSVSSSSSSAFADALLAEVAAGSVRSRQGAVDFLTWTFYYRRLLKNPSYYGLEAGGGEGEGAGASDGDGDDGDCEPPAPSAADLARHLSSVAERALRQLSAAGLISGLSPLGDDPKGTSEVAATELGRVAARWRLGLAAAAALGRGLLAVASSSAAVPSPPPNQQRPLHSRRFRALFDLLTTSPELSRGGGGGGEGALQVRHGDDRLVAALAASSSSSSFSSKSSSISSSSSSNSSSCRWGVSPPGTPLDSVAAKASLLVQGCLCRVERWPSLDFAADARRCLGVVSRLAAAAAEIAVSSSSPSSPPQSSPSEGSPRAAETALAALVLRQCLCQGLWPDDAPAKQLCGDRRTGAALARAVEEGAGEEKERASSSSSSSSSSSAAAAAAAAAVIPRWLSLASDPDLLQRRAAALSGLTTLSPRDSASAAAAAARLPAPTLSWRVAEVRKERDVVVVEVAVARGRSVAAVVEASLTSAPAPAPAPASAPPRPPRAVAPRSPEVRYEAWELLAVAADRGIDEQGTGKRLGAGRTLLQTRRGGGRGAGGKKGKTKVVLGGDGKAEKVSLELSVPTSSSTAFTSPEALLRAPVDLLLVSSCYSGLDAAARLPPLGVLLSLDPSSSSSSFPSGDGSPWSAAEVVAVAMKEEEDEAGRRRQGQRGGGGGRGGRGEQGGGSSAAAAAAAAASAIPPPVPLPENDNDDDEDDAATYGDDAPRGR